MEKGSPIPVITIYADKSFTFEMKHAAGVLLPEEGGRIGKGSKDARPRAAPAGPRRRCARSPRKMKDLNATFHRAAMKMIEGSARSMGLRCRSR
jgi:large subunit ribosomal protein L11